jgi:hypothetical protein
MTTKEPPVVRARRKIIEDARNQTGGDIVAAANRLNEMLSDPTRPSVERMVREILVAWLDQDGAAEQFVRNWVWYE